MGIIFVVFLLNGWMVIAEHENMTFVASLVFMLLCVVVPTVISIAIVHKKAPVMNKFYEHHSWFVFVSLALWFVIALYFYESETSTWPRRSSAGQLAAAIVIATPFHCFAMTLLSLNKKFQAWAIKEMVQLLNLKPAAPAPDWKIKTEASESPYGDNVTTFDPERFKRPAAPIRQTKGPTKDDC